MPNQIPTVRVKPRTSCVTWGCGVWFAIALAMAIFHTFAGR